MSRSQLAWHPDGGSLLAAPGEAVHAVRVHAALSSIAFYQLPDSFRAPSARLPGTDHDVVLYERMSWEPAFSLSGQHSADVSLVAFCKNGAPRLCLARASCLAHAASRCPARHPPVLASALPHSQQPEPSPHPCQLRSAGLYLVSAAADQAVVLWDVNERKVLEKRLLPGCATDLAWHPTQNALAIITEDGGCTWGACALKRGRDSSRVVATGGSEVGVRWAVRRGPSSPCSVAASLPRCALATSLPTSCGYSTPPPPPCPPLFPPHTVQRF